MSKYVCDNPCIECEGNPCKVESIPENDYDKPCSIGKYPKWKLIETESKKEVKTNEAN